MIAGHQRVTEGDILIGATYVTDLPRAKRGTAMMFQSYALFSFGLLVMFAIFNRFDNRSEEAARDLGATPWETLRHVALPIILPSVIGVGLFGFTLSCD
jgi:ABC-type spermidine/putrescine transport system permease subunit II